MATFVLSTVGTSLLGNYRRQIDSVDGLPDYQAFLATLNKLDSHDRVCGAEINSLAKLFFPRTKDRLSLKPPFSLAFLVSDTEEGKWTGQILKAYWESGKRNLKIDSVEIHIIEGLQHGNPQKFATHGLRNLVKTASKLLKNHEDKERFINATGGYKAQISFAGLIGQTIGVPVIYLFENFDNYIKMPPMPVDFSKDLWLEHYDLFRIMSEEGSLETTDSQLDGADPIFIELLDKYEEDGIILYALSPILELMHQGFLIRQWPKEVKQPSNSTIKQKDKLAITWSETHHAAKNSTEFMEKLAELPWVNRVRNIKFANTRRSRVITKKDPDNPDEIQCYYADSNMALVIAVNTTAKDDGERNWCLSTLNEILNK